MQPRAQAITLVGGNDRTFGFRHSKIGSLDRAFRKGKVNQQPIRTRFLVEFLLQVHLHQHTDIAADTEFKFGPRRYCLTR